MATFDGKTLGEFYRTDYDYFDRERAGPNGMRDKSPEAYQVDALLGVGPRREFFAPLRAAGIPPSQYQYYANKAGIKNVNSRSDLDQIIAAYNADERFQGSPDSKSSDEPVVAVAADPEPDKPDPIKEEAAKEFLDTYKRANDFKREQAGEKTDDEDDDDDKDMLEKKLMASKYMDTDRKSFIEDAYDFKENYTRNFMDSRFRRA